MGTSIALYNGKGLTTSKRDESTDKHCAYECEEIGEEVKRILFGGKFFKEGEGNVLRFLNEYFQTNI